MDDSEFKPFELTDFGSDKSKPVQVASEETGFHLLEYDASEDLVSISELHEKSDEEKIALSESYHTDDFNREDSLLTNAEDYAKTIREGAQLFKQQLVAKNEATLQETERIKQETQALRKTTDEERIRILEQAQAEVQSIKDAAYEEGFKSGQEQGIEKRYQEALPLVQRAKEVLGQLEHLRQIVRFQGEQELVQLAILLAKKVVIEEIRTRPDLLNLILQTSLKEIESLGKIRVHLHPDDYEFLHKSGLNLDQFLREEQSLIIKSDPEAVPGSIYMESDEEAINFNFQKRFKELEQALNEELSESHARLSEVDIDAHDFKKISQNPSATSQDEHRDKSAKSSLHDEPDKNKDTKANILNEDNAQQLIKTKLGEEAAADEEEIVVDSNSSGIQQAVSEESIEGSNKESMKT